MNKIKPIILTDTDTGAEYTLEFSRETVKYAENHGFDIDRLTNEHNKLMTDVPDLFYYAFKMHHKGISHEKTNSILFDDLGGITVPMLTRLIELYNVPFGTLIRNEEEDDGDEKNLKMAITL